MAHPRRNPLSKVGFAFSIIGSFIFWVPSYWVMLAGNAFLGLGLLFSLISLIIGLTGRRGIGFSITGLFISIIGLIITAVFFLTFLKTHSAF
jgi:hypothetical protein